MEIIGIARSLIFLALGLSVLLFLLCLIGILRRDRRFIRTTRVGLGVLFVLVLFSTVGLVEGFVHGRYNVEYIYNYSERSLGLGYKIAGLWGGLSGSLLLWCLILTAYSALVALQHRASSRHAVGRRLEPYVYLVLLVVDAFFIALTAFEVDPFKVLPEEARRFASVRSSGIPSLEVPDGAGLNPLLVSAWMIIHPPSLYLGYIGFTVPYAFAIASLIAGESGDYWIRITRRWTMVSWIFLTAGIVLGGLWAYEVLTWPGYWGWDPVENASLLPWLSGTAFLHSVMIQERRNMLKGWNVFLIILTFLLSIFGTYLTRSGVVGSRHAFAGGAVGVWFLVFMGAIVSSGLFLIARRWPVLRSPARLESLVSREASFFFNNLVLVSIAAAVFILTMFPRFSQDLFGRAMSVGVPVYTMVTTPFFALLLFLTAIGPQIGWIRATPENLRRNFLVPVVVCLAGTLGLLAAWRGMGFYGSYREMVSPYLFPGATMLCLAGFITLTTMAQFYRGARARVAMKGEPILTAFLRLVASNNRRYGGYVVHLGVALMVVGIVFSGMFSEDRDVTLKEGQSVDLGPYRATLVDRSTVETGVYRADRCRFEITRGKTRIGEVEPELRQYLKKDQPMGQVTIRRGVVEDIYIAYGSRNEDGTGNFVLARKPLIGLIWIGWMVMTAGAIFALLPTGRRKVGLSE